MSYLAYSVVSFLAYFVEHEYDTKPFARSWRKTTRLRSGELRRDTQLMVPGGHLMAQNDNSWSHENNMRQKQIGQIRADDIYG